MILSTGEWLKLPSGPSRNLAYSKGYNAKKRKYMNKTTNEHKHVGFSLSMVLIIVRK